MPGFSPRFFLSNSTMAMLLRMAGFFPRFSLSSSSMATEGHLTPSGFPWVWATGSCATPVVVNNVGWGVLYDVRVL